MDIVGVYLLARLKAKGGFGFVQDKFSNVYVYPFLSIIILDNFGRWSK